MRTEPIRLYNIIEDPHERRNLFQEHPEIVKVLKSKIDEWSPLKDRKLLLTE